MSDSGSEKGEPSMAKLQQRASERGVRLKRLQALIERTDTEIVSLSCQFTNKALKAENLRSVLGIDMETEGQKAFIGNLK